MRTREQIRAEMLARVKAEELIRGRRHATDENSQLWVLCDAFAEQVEKECKAAKLEAIEP